MPGLRLAPPPIAPLFLMNQDHQCMLVNSKKLQSTVEAKGPVLHEGILADHDILQEKPRHQTQQGNFVSPAIPDLL